MEAFFVRSTKQVHVIRHQYITPDEPRLGIDPHGRRIDANGLAGEEVPVSRAALQISDPDVAPGSAGGFLVTWTDREVIFGRGVETSGEPMGGEFQISVYTPSFKGYPAAAAVGDGRFVVVWDSLFQDGGYYGIFGRSL